ncbi:hypothetical protein JBP901_gp048 [Bacillus phage JBP901]|uniref:Uncharacterized protein n=1 Tax=Bacillus phage JBP901 TaxID=1498212 RepID=A0A0E3DF24_9CAUD|nr:hypothetical protein JBP901_gp048 [Bacillus phage JBP901]AID17761.1 hypothetical protein JBP901_gp048 [Bacillus phage JBP901]
MTQLEHFMYIRMLFQEAEGYGQLSKVYDEMVKYCEKHNADFDNTLHLL